MRSWCSGRHSRRSLAKVSAAVVLLVGLNVCVVSSLAHEPAESGRVIVMAKVPIDAAGSREQAMTARVREAQLLMTRASGAALCCGLRGELRDRSLA